MRRGLEDGWTAATAPPLFAHMEKISRPFFLSLHLSGAAAATAARSGGRDSLKVGTETPPVQFHIYFYIYFIFFLPPPWIFLVQLEDLIYQVNFIARSRQNKH